MKFTEYMNDFCIEPEVKILGEPVITLSEGLTINLTCVIRFLPEPPTTVGWMHDDQVCSLLIQSMFLFFRCFL